MCIRDSYSPCYITKGLLDKSLTSDAQCQAQSNVLFLTNFQQYTRSEFADDYIEVTFTALLPKLVQKTSPVEIYTYIDEQFLLLVDCNSTSEYSRLDIYAARIFSKENFLI